MLKISTGLKSVNASPEKVFAFLADMNNLEKLMPDQVTNWKSDENTCTFTIKGMADIGMEILQRHPNERIQVGSYGKVPFKFNLEIVVKPSGDTSEAGLDFEGDVNPFLKMMVEKPLSNFFGMLIDNLNKQF